MRQLNNWQNAIFLAGAVMMVAGAGGTLLQWAAAPWLFAAGTLGFASMQMLQRYEGSNFTIRRLRRIMLLSDVLFLVSALLMLASQGNVFPIDHITYLPLENGFSADDCAATELNGNTRDGAVDFPGIRTYTLQGEVHDEMAYHSMNGISGHAGLFSNAIDLAKLASLMLTGGYEGHHFFSRDLIDTFIAPISRENANAALGWARQGDDRRSWYFSCQASSNTIGHQGWTGTLVMIDPQNDIVMAYLTNERNTSLPDKETNANDFNGLYYTASTLGFVPQIFMIGLDQEGDVSEQLKSLLNSMCDDAERLAQGSEEGSAAYLNYLSKKAVLEKWQAQ